jgi:hypothetical protein
VTSGPLDEVAPAIPDGGETAVVEPATRRGRRARGRHARGRRDRGQQPVATFRPGRLARLAAGARRFVVLSAPSPEGDVVVVDLATSVLARLEGLPGIVGAAQLPGGALGPFAVLDVPSAALGPPNDPARPESRRVTAPASVAGILGRRRARRLLRTLLAPPEPQLLGFAGPSWPYWELRGDRPSVAVVAPTRGPVVYRRAEDDAVWIRFGWHRTDNWLPMTDPVVTDAVMASGRTRLGGRALAAALGFRPSYLVVVVGRPQEGYCPKLVVSILPRP